LASNPSSATFNKPGDFDEDVQQLLGAEFLPPKDLVDMTAEDVADKVATGPVRK
jgi:hypothetical protein